jgi:toxin FitB
MNYLLDTCVLSEFTRRQQNEKVVRWLEQADEEKLYISAITIGEIQRGIERMSPSQRKSDLQRWLNDGLIARFGVRTLPLDAQTMILWGSLTARMENSGQPIPVMDSLIVASALQHDLIIVTRNVSDFLPAGVQVIDPWQ